MPPEKPTIGEVKYRLEAGGYSIWSIVSTDKGFRAFDWKATVAEVETAGGIGKYVGERIAPELDVLAKAFAGDTSVIPNGPYCYKRLSSFESGWGKIEPCPYLKIHPEKPEQERGYCHFLKTGDWFSNGTSLLWDMVKECGINEE
jgi:hypothetical protein